MRLSEIKRGQKDSNGNTKCWPGKHAEGTKKGKNGGQVRNCVPNENVEEHIVKANEAFDQPYPIKWEKSEHGDYDAMATLPGGKPLSIMFDHESPDEVVITFWRNNNLDLTGEGDAQRVFATVLQSIQEFLKIEQPATISFSASKEVEPGQNSMSRSKLYDRLVKRYAQQWGYNAQTVDHEEGVVYKLSRKSEVDEAVNPDIVSKNYFIEPTKNVRMGDFEFNARTFTGGLGVPNARGLQIRAYDPSQPKGQNLIGSADFIVKSDKKGNQWLESDDTEVNDEYRGKGVAAMMYAFAKSLGNDIKRSPYQSQKGREMWNKWGSDAEHLKKEGVAEGIDDGRAYIKRLTRKRVDDSIEVRYHVINGNGVTVKVFDDLNNAKSYLRANRDMLDKE
jgi:predicted GNAT family acetyltransferase